MAAGPTFALHIPTEVAEGDDEMDIAFPHTPRHDASWHDAEPAAELIEQCLRPGHCGAPEGDVRDWLHRRLVQLGHATNDRDQTLMAHTWFECAYAARASVAELISSTNMRLKLGQWALVDEVYKQILQMALSDAQREVAERKHSEVTELKGSGSARPLSVTPEEELSALLTSAGIAAETVSEPAEIERMVQLLRSCGFAANKAGDFEAAHLWFDCSFAFSSSLCDLLSAANMRVKLDKTSPVAAAAYKHVLNGEGRTEVERSMASRKLASLEEAGAAEAQQKQRVNAADTGVSYGGNISAR